MEHTASENDRNAKTSSDRELVAGLRAHDARSVDEFIRRFEPLVARCASSLGVPHDERRQWVADVLYDAAMTLGRRTKRSPRDLSKYIAGACRLRVLENREREQAYRSRVFDALRHIHDNSAEFRELVVSGLSSEQSLRDARGPDWEPQALSPLLQRLVNAIEDGMTPDEHQLLEWLGDQLSYTQIAQRLGITRPAAVSRAQRLRVKLIGAALRFGAMLGHAERAAFLRFLRRTGALPEETVEAAARGPNAGSDKEDPR